VPVRRENRDLMGGGIVVGTDGSETAALAVLKAGEIAKALGEPVHLVSAYEPVQSRAARGAGSAAAELAVRSDTAVESLLAEAVGALRTMGVTVAQTYSRRGDPADVILDVAEEQQAEMIVVGNKGMSGARRFLLGSVPNKVSHHAPCSVLIVRTS
jgi:nucleotide-binding universal stress UspA family protein